jgi:hypothetical protein
MQVMVERDGLPIAFAVTDLAFVSIPPFMSVVFLVAGITVQRRVLEGRCKMTFLAFHGRVLAYERKARLVMVEWGLFPGALIMTVFAMDTLLTLMLVVFLMARITIHRRIFVAVVGMAVFTGHLPVLVAQLVAGLVMVKPDFLPVAFRMTVGADGARLPLVLVIFLMTAIAFGWGVTVFDFGLVTGLAFDLLCIRMRAPQVEVRPFMVKRILRNRRDVFSPAFVFRVAILALVPFFKAPV